MFISFFLQLRAPKVLASLREFLTLMEAMRAGVARFEIDAFCVVARTALVAGQQAVDPFEQLALFNRWERG